jgi:hypothetical protein
VRPPPGVTSRQVRAPDRGRRWPGGRRAKPLA